MMGGAAPGIAMGSVPMGGADSGFGGASAFAGTGNPADALPF